jgi:hypothetical protein
VPDKTATMPITETEQRHKKIQNNLTNNKRKRKRYNKISHIQTSNNNNIIIEEEIFKRYNFFLNIMILPSHSVPGPVSKRTLEGHKT